MLRIVTLEQNSEQEVHTVRNLGALALVPVLIATVAIIVWSLGSADPVGERLVVAAGLVLLSALQVFVMVVSVRPVEITVRSDRVLVGQAMVATFFSAVSYRHVTPLEAGESILPEPVRTGASSYSVVTSSTGRAVAKRVPSRRMAGQLAKLLEASLARLRDADS